MNTNAFTMNEVLLSNLHKLYIDGECFLSNYESVFELKYTKILDAFRKRGLKTLNFSEMWSVYGNFISEKRDNTCIKRCGYKNYMQNPELLAQRIQKYREVNGVDNPMQNPKVKETHRKSTMTNGGYTFQRESSSKRAHETMITNYGGVYNFSHPDHHKRVKSTMIEKYNVDNPSKFTAFQEKKIQTNLRKRGVKWAPQDPEVRAQQIATLMENWQVDNPSRNPEIQAKKAVTAGINFGGVGFSSPIINSRIQTTNLETYGDIYPSRTPEIIKKNRRTRADNDPRYETLLNLREAKESGDVITESQVIEVAGLFCKSQELAILKEFGIKEPCRFTTEIKVQNLLDSLEVEYIRRAKKIHGVKKDHDWYELDIFIPEIKLGIEINGRAFHAVNKAAKGDPKTPEYHFEKFKAFHESGILMLSFTDYEQDHFRDDYVSIIKHHLNLLSIEDLHVSDKFLEFNQIKSLEESLNYGLFDPNQFTGNFEDHQHQRFIEDFEYWDCGIIKMP